MTIRELILQGTAIIAAGTESDTPRLDAQILYGFVSATKKETLIANMRDTVPSGIEDIFMQLCRKRATGYPVAYITGKKEFFGRDFAVNESVLIPRPETELLVEWVLEANFLPTTRILDCCTGSGCIATTIVLEALVHMEACDISAEALSVARNNAETLGAGTRLIFHQGNLFDALPTGTLPFDIITANPPYVPRVESRKIVDRGWSEPLLALDGGDDGLDIIRNLLIGLPHYLRPGGLLFMEYGDGQTTPLIALLEAHGLEEIEIRRDLAGIDRIVRAKLSRYDGERGSNA